MPYKMDITRMQIMIFVLIFIASRQFCSAEVFTSISEMEELLESHGVIINNLEAYVAAHESNLDYIKRRIIKYQKEHDKATKDIGEYISNPINAYLLTKRLTTDWSILESFMSNDIGNVLLKNVTMHRDIMTFPTDEDLKGAASALLRLQETYNLKAASIARGELNGVQYGSEMTTHDCFVIGKQAYKEKDYSQALQWFNEANAKLDNNIDENVSKIRILEYMAWCMYEEGNISLALETTIEILKLDPDHVQSIDNKEIYENLLAEEGETSSKRENQYEEQEGEEGKVFDNYQKLCRGELKQDPKLLAKLKCQYVTNKSAFLKIAPFKTEEANLTPYIVVYHDVIYDREIAKIKQLTRKKFSRAGVLDSDGNTEYTNYRIAKTAWLKDEDHEVIQKISNRIGDMTGLSMETAEQLQIGNYGIGGHYEPHIDHSADDVIDLFDDIGAGNRIATVLFYLSDVAQGGATVFPLLNLAVWPQKGSAAFWHNLYRSGRGDYNTKHAACPVLAGNKIVCNKWIHEYGQEFLRPCELEPDHPWHHL